MMRTLLRQITNVEDGRVSLHALPERLFGRRDIRQPTAEVTAIAPTPSGKQHHAHGAEAGFQGA